MLMFIIKHEWQLIAYELKMCMFLILCPSTCNLNLNTKKKKMTNYLINLLYYKIFTPIIVYEYCLNMI